MRQRVLRVTAEGLGRHDHGCPGHRDDATLAGAAVTSPHDEPALGVAR